ncbi:hypothetical protein BRADI_4g13794v3 [Brachypodium distachyon]|uniref:Uncharacterized protein n=1 Tax=Brachypodium distachyon TaxID=15368 RepID=A0A0Q3PET4_BRADI|nr:hypothetical protein BRADI_4g13794v3 [Brachypodium distachyon]
MNAAMLKSSQSAETKQHMLVVASATSDKSKPRNRRPSGLRPSTHSTMALDVNPDTASTPAEVLQGPPARHLRIQPKYEIGDGKDDNDVGDSDLDLAWKQLNFARVIVEKSPNDNAMEKFKILFALAEVSMERGDFDNLLGYYFKALAILEHVVEPDHPGIAKLNFRICLCFAFVSVVPKLADAIPYCAKAISLYKSRKQRLENAMKALLADEGDNASAAEGRS